MFPTWEKMTPRQTSTQEHARRSGRAFSVTLPMRLMPPSRISATRAARDRPMTQWITVMPLSFIVKKAVMAFVMEPVDGVHLTHVADAEARDAGESWPPLPATSTSGRCRRYNTSGRYPVAIFIALAVLNGEHDLRVLYDHAKQRGDPQPKHSAIAAEGDGLAGTDYGCRCRCGKSGGHGLRDGAFSPVSVFLNILPTKLRCIRRAGFVRTVSSMPPTMTQGRTCTATRSR